MEGWPHLENQFTRPISDASHELNASDFVETPLSIPANSRPLPGGSPGFRSAPTCEPRPTFGPRQRLCSIDNMSASRF